MPHIAVISSSIRQGRKSHRVALYFKNYLEQNKLGTVEMLDLTAYNFPLFDERLKHQDNPSERTLDFTEKIKSAEGVIIITPEYNGGYPASLKNVIDLLYDEWRRKPIAIATVSAGDLGGAQVITSLQFSLWKIQAWTVPSVFPVPNVEHTFSKKGIPDDPTSTDKRAKVFIDELLWCIEAKNRMAVKNIKKSQVKLSTEIGLNGSS